MQTLPQIELALLPPTLPDYVPLSPRMTACVCPWCRSLLLHPPAPAIPASPHVCVLVEPRRTHHILCRDCASIIAILYYYRNGWRQTIPHKVFRGARVAVYVELERLGATQTHSVQVSIASLARTIRYGYDATRDALHDLARAGYIHDMRLSQRRHMYTILIHQLPKGE